MNIYRWGLLICSPRVDSFAVIQKGKREIQGEGTGPPFAGTVIRECVCKNFVDASLVNLSDKKRLYGKVVTPWK